VERHQVTAFLPPPISEQVDEIRRQWDPEMAHRIAAHITLVHEPRNDQSFRRGLDLIANGRQLEVRLTDAHCWGTPEGGIYLAVEDIRGDIDRVRRALQAVEQPDVLYEPHLTLVHPRTATPTRLRDAWDRLGGWAIDETVMLDTISVIELKDSQWHVATSVSLASE
jgi:2'-5' RNA ligase